ncbi:NAD-dependent malic enzyme [Altererythrobacter sp.]|nr:NAD-dependent malic enzyme [Altererythrobacter sp.]
MTTGKALLRDPALTKSTGFTLEERKERGLRGLLPYSVTSLEAQCERVLENLRRKENDIEKYVFLSALQDRNETLFYYVISHNIDEMMPLIYTPTVGQACQEFAHIFRRPKGFYITPDDKGQISAMLDNWPEKDVKVVVITDGERILGLGDLGANGMGIPIGKLALYTACAGIHPSQCLPVMLDVGTKNEKLRNDPMYLGYPTERVSGEEYRALISEFVTAIQRKYPDALIQFEDFLTPNAYALLEEYRDKILCFNDDIQGTAAVALAGVYAGARATGTAFRDMRIMFLGAGSAATGIGDLLTAALIKEGLSQAEARERIWFVDQVGLVTKSRDDLLPHNYPYAHDIEGGTFLEAIDRHKPHVLIGATGAPGTFSEAVIKAMAVLHEEPIIFALSNPTSKAECTAEQAYKWSDGRALFASGSPFGPVELNGVTHKPGQGNNAYVFPGIGLGAVAGEMRRLPESSFLTAARALSDMVSNDDLGSGSLYPPLADIRNVSRTIAFATIKDAVASGNSGLKACDDAELNQRLDDAIYVPSY